MLRIIKTAGGGVGEKPPGREPIKVLWTDPGTEFTSRKFRDVMGKYEIVHRITEPKNHAPLGRIDRFHLTLRTILERWFLRAGSGQHAHNWVDSLPKIIEAYNARESRAIGMAPAKTTSKDIERIRSEDIARAMRVADRVDKLKLLPGTSVRHITNRVGFTKGSAPKWSSTVHEIQNREGVDRFKVKGLQGTYKDYELQAVSQVLDSGWNPAVSNFEREKEKKVRKTARTMKREGIEQRAPSPRRLRSGRKI